MPGQDPHGTFPCLLKRAENPEIQPLPALSQQVSGIDGNDDRGPSKPNIDCVFFSSTALVSKLLSLQRSKKKGKSGWAE